MKEKNRRDLKEERKKGEKEKGKAREGTYVFGHSSDRESPFAMIRTVQIGPLFHSMHRHSNTFCSCVKKDTSGARSELVAPACR